MQKRNLSERIITEILYSGELSCSELVTKTGMSRTSVQNELLRLQESLILSSSSTKRKLQINPDISICILKLHTHRAQLLRVSSNGIKQKQDIELLSSLPYEENIIYWCQSAKEYFLPSLKNDKISVFCIIADQNKISGALPKEFKITQNRAQLIAIHLNRTLGGGSALYINSKEPLYVLCQDGKVVVHGACNTDSALTGISSAISIFSPSKVIFDQGEISSLKNVCSSSKISTFSYSDELSLDEKEMLLLALFSLLKK